MDPNTYGDKARFDHAFGVLSFWRSSHEYALLDAFDMLAVLSEEVDKNALVAKRLKRHVSIVRKLERNKNNRMQLKNMQDIAGCRVVVSNKKRVYQLVRLLKKRHDFRAKNGERKYKDYIEKPKADGYRSYHLIGQFPRSGQQKKYVEIQIRTRLQHSWATALEIVDLFTGQALKSNAGDKKWMDFFANIGHQFAIMDEMHQYEKLTSKEKLRNFSAQLHKKDVGSSERESNLRAYKLAHQLKVVTIFNAFAHSLKTIDAHYIPTEEEGYVLLMIDLKSLVLNAESFGKDRTKEAERKYTEEEKLAANDTNKVVALVSTNAIGGIKEAYPNFFADSTIFLENLDIVMGSHQRINPNVLEKLLGL